MRAAELLVMSVTRLGAGVCVACLRDTRTWVRPTREGPGGWRQLEVGDLCGATGRVVIEVGNVVRWPLGRHMPRAVHTEDYEVAGRPEFVHTLANDELAAACAAVCERDLPGFLRGDDRSLTALRPETVTSLRFRHERPDEYSLRLTLEHQGLHEDLSVTDLRWRALGRVLLDRFQSLRLAWSHADLQRHARRCIQCLVLGRGQGWEGREHPLAGEYWPFVTTVITDPPTIEPIDYARL